MQASRKALSFWQPKRRLLALARALRAGLQGTRRPAMPAQSLAAARIRDRMATEGRRKARFSEH